MHLSWAQVTLAEQQPSGGYYYLVLPPQRAQSSEHGFRQNILLWPIAGPASSCHLTQSWICWLLDVVYLNYIYIRLKNALMSYQHHVFRATISSISLLQTLSSASFVMFVQWLDAYSGLRDFLRFGDELSEIGTKLKLPVPWLRGFMRRWGFSLKKSYRKFEGWGSHMIFHDMVVYQFRIAPQGRFYK